VRLSLIIKELIAGQRERVTAKLARLRALPADTFDAAVLTSQIRRGAPRDPDVLAWFRDNPHASRTAERAARELGTAGAWMLDDGLLYSIDERARTAYFTEDGQAEIEGRLGPLFALPAVNGDTLAALHNLVVAFALFERDRDYLIRDGRIVLIEEATGRAAESRRYMHGLHTAIEVKELGVPERESDTLAQISVQQFVRQYRRRAGMTGTARPAANEFARIYDMAVTRVPRHRPNRRVDLPPRLYRTPADVDAALVEDVAAAHRLGRPVLVGTSDVGRSERLSTSLTTAGLPHVVLNARGHADEAEVVAAAGQPGAITIATNMAGRGTDISLASELETHIVTRAVAEIRRLIAGGTVTVNCASDRAAWALRAALGFDDQVTIEVTARTVHVHPRPSGVVSVRGRGGVSSPPTAGSGEDSADQGRDGPRVLPGYGQCLGACAGRDI